MPSRNVAPNGVLVETMTGSIAAVARFHTRLKMASTISAKGMTTTPTVMTTASTAKSTTQPNTSAPATRQNQCRAV